MQMLLQIMQDYATLPPVENLTLAEINTYYDGRRRALRDATKSRN